MSPRRTRLDAEMVRRGLARSRTEARSLIEAGQVTVGGAPATKPATLVVAGDAVAVTAERRWASRGGEKLDGALDELGLAVAGRYALDAGASTGGFTDVLLERGAARVVAVDVGYGQLDWRLRTDDRVVVMDRTNVRTLQPGDVPDPAPSLVVADLSFISLTVALPGLVRVADPDAEYVLLVKPQFEAGPEGVGKGGVVREPRYWRLALERVAAAAAGLGLAVRDVVVSPLRGPAGNVEFFVHLVSGTAEVDDDGRAAVVDNQTALTIDRAVSLASGA